MKMTRLRAHCALAFLFVPIVLASTITSCFADFRPGRDAYLRGDYRHAFALFLREALQGDVKSRIGLGLLLARGHGMERDFVRSYAWHDAALADGRNEHIVVQILARTNRDYLARHMTPTEIEAAKLRSAMMRARTGRSMTGLKPVKASLRSGKAKAVADGDTPPMRYAIQLAARRPGHRTDLLIVWSRLAERYDGLRRLKPALVRLDVPGRGIYDGLRAGSFDTAGDALGACAALVADKQDCFVVAR